MAYKQLGLAPSGPTDDTTKGYVDNAISTAAGTAQTLTSKTINGPDNTLTNVTGMIRFVRINTYGGETYTIVAGSVTQISGTTINGYSPAIGDRILVSAAPASSGAGTPYTATTQPANGIYVVTGNTTNLTVARANDMSGTVHPAGVNVYVGSDPNVSTWGESYWRVLAPRSPSTSHTWGTDVLQWTSWLGSSAEIRAYRLRASDQLELGAGSSTQYLAQLRGSTSATATQTLTLPSVITDVLVSRTSTDTLTNKTLGNTTTVRLKDSNFKLEDDGDSTKTIDFQLSGLTSGVNRTLTVPDTNFTIVGDTTTNTLTNKTLTAPVVTSPWISGTIKDSNGNNLLSLTQNASAVNYLTIENKPIGNHPTLYATGSDTDVTLMIAPKGGGQVRIYTASGTTPALRADGGDTNMDLNLISKGTGVVKANSVEVVTLSGTQTLTSKTIGADQVIDGTTNKAYTATEKTKLAGIATGATANSSDATLLARANHTGTQLAATISDFSTAADARVVAGITGKVSTTTTVNGQALSANVTLTQQDILRSTVINAPGGTPTVNIGSWDQIAYTGLAAAITSMTTGLTGTPEDGQRLMLRFTDNGTARAITWGASFASTGVATLLATTVATKTHYVGFIYNGTASTWDCVAVDAVGR